MASPSDNNPDDSPTPVDGLGYGGLPDVPTGGGEPPVVVVVDGAVAACNQALANADAAIRAQIQECFTECRISAGSCEACIRGLIEAQLSTVGQSLSKCDAKIANQLVDSITTLAMSAASIGVEPPGMGGGDGGGLPAGPPTIITSDDYIATTPPGSIPPVVEQGGGQGEIVNNPAACLPSDFNEREIVDWVHANIGPVAMIYQLPTATTPGIAGLYENRYPIPPLCGPPSVPTIPFPVNTDTIGGGSGGGGTIVTIPPPGGSMPPGIGTIINIPQPGAGGTIINVPQPTSPSVPSVSCGTPVQTIVNVPSCPAPTPVAECKPCQQATVTSVGAATIPNPLDNNAWNAWLNDVMPGGVWRTYPTAVAPGLAVSQDGSKCVVVVWVAGANIISGIGITKPDHLPPLGGDYCSPDTVQQGWQQILAYADSTGGKANKLLQVVGAMIGPIIAGAIEKVTGLDDIPGLGAITSAVAALAGGAAGPNLRSVLQPGTSDSNCKSDAFIVASVSRAYLSLFGGWFGTIPDATIRDWDYKINAFCPNTLPDQGTLNSLYLRGWITSDQWKIPTRMLGNCVDWQQRAVDSGQAIPGINETIAAFRRDILEEGEADYLFSKNGLTSSRWREVFYQLSEYVPGPSDLVTFMVRDVFDPKVVDKYRLDADFDNKFQGRVVDWAQSQGMSKDTFLNYWRSHWQYASPGQIYEMVHRLRPNDRSPSDPYGNIVFTLDDARDALQVQDISPYFVDRLLATSFRPVSQRLILTGIKGGEYTVDDIRRAFLDQGLRPDDAEKIARAYFRANATTIAKANGYATPADILKWYKALAINRDQAAAKLKETGFTDDQSERTLSSADLSIMASARTTAMKALKRRYMTGEFNDGEINKALIDAGLDVNRTGDAILSWRVERDAKYKGPTVAMLCEWLGRGVIDADGFYSRVTNMGYPIADATRIVQVCQLGIRDKVNKATEKAAKDADAAVKKGIAQQKAAARDSRAAAKQLHQDWLDKLPCKPAKKPTCPQPAVPAELPTEAPE